MFKLEEWMRVLNGVFTFGTEVEVFADRAFVADTDDWGGTAAITGKTFVNYVIFLNINVLHW
jgi:hypothetical protein